VLPWGFAPPPRRRRRLDELPLSALVQHQIEEIGKGRSRPGPVADGMRRAVAAGVTDPAVHAWASLPGAGWLTESIMQRSVGARPPMRAPQFQCCREALQLSSTPTLRLGVDRWVGGV